MVKFKALRMRMLELEYTQSDLAAAIGIAKSTLSGRLRGEYPFTLKEVSAISKVLDIAIEDWPIYFHDGL